MNIEPGRVYEFRKDGIKHTLVWRVWVNGPEVHTEAGVHGGQLQHTFDFTRSVGKKGTKAYKAPPEQALLVAARKVKKKTEEGYAEIDPKTGKPKKRAVKTLDFNRLPKEFASFKPVTNSKVQEGMPEWKKLKAVLNSNGEIITIKRNGMMHYVLITNTGDVRLYTRRMEECTTHYPRIVSSFKSMNLPTKTVLACEFVVVIKGVDDRLSMQSLSRSLPERARRIQDDKGTRPHAVVLAPLFWNEEPIVKTWPVGTWIEFLDMQFSETPDNISCMEVFFGNLEEAEDYVIKHRKEGLVIYDSTATFESKAFNFRGKPERPACWKHKPMFEDDFVLVFDPDCKFAQWTALGHTGSYGKGKLKSLVGKVALYQYDKIGRLHYISNCGSGFSEDQRLEMLETARKNRGVAGVGVVKFTDRRYKSKGDKTNALTEPIFLHWHTDKLPKECIDEDL